jgi:hypothetical protein
MLLQHNKPAIGKNNIIQNNGNLPAKKLGTHLTSIAQNNHIGKLNNAINNIKEVIIPQLNLMYCII